MTIQLRTIGWVILVALATTGVVLVALTLLLGSRVQGIDRSWSQFGVERDAKMGALIQLRSELGYGGAAQLFKQHVFNPTDTEIPLSIQARIGGALAALQRYEALGIEDWERESIDTIRGTLRRYLMVLPRIGRMGAEGRSPDEIHRALTSDAGGGLDDGPAIEAIIILEEDAIDRLIQSDTRSAQFLQLQRALGYGGMVDKVYEAVLAGNAGQLMLAGSEVEFAAIAVDEYRGLDLTESEEAALVSIEEMLDQYRDAVAALQGLARAPMAERGAALDIDATETRAAFAALLQGLEAQLALSAAEVETRLTEVGWYTLVLVVVTVSMVVFLIGLSVWAIRHRVVGRVTRLTERMTALAEGDQSVEVDDLVGADEIGEMVDAFRVFKENLIRTEALQAESAANQEARLRRAQQLQELTNKFEEAVQTIMHGVARSIDHLSDTSTQMSSAADRSNHLTATVASASEEATASVNSVAAATEQLRASIQEIARQVAQSAEVARAATQQADLTNEVVSRLTTDADRIGEVVSLINDIAEQTNLLALNATIEAARAGEAGKGFAVVAQEVKNLATQTGKATGEIGEQVRGIQEATDSAVSAIGLIAERVGEINVIAAAISAAIEQQAAATQEISRSIQQAATGTQDVTANIVGVSDAARTTEDSARNVRAASDQLNTETERLQHCVRGFLEDVQTA